MNCRECQDLLQRSLDGDTGAAGPALERHVAVCPGCRKLHAAAQRLGEGLRLLPCPAPPADLAPRIVARVLRERRRRQRFRLLEAATAVAASLLLVVFVGRTWQRPSPGSLAAPPVGQTEPTVVPAASASLQQRVEEAGLAVVALTRRTADETVSQTRLFLPVVGLLPAEGDNPQQSETLLDPPARSLREIGQGVTAGLEPVAVSARRAVSRFLHDLPPMP